MTTKNEFVVIYLRRIGIPGRKLYHLIDELSLHQKVNSELAPLCGDMRTEDDDPWVEVEHGERPCCQHCRFIASKLPLIVGCWK